MRYLPHCFVAAFVGIALTGCTSHSDKVLEGDNHFPVVEQPLPNDLANLRNPFWLDRERFGFVTGTLNRSRMLDGALFIYNLHTQHLEELLDRSVWDARFLPKQNRLAFLQIVGNQGLTLFTASLSGKGVTEEFEGRGYVIFGPSWSPDERQLAYSDSSYDADLLIVDAKTGKGEVVNTGRGSETSGTEDPDWSPDGANVVCTGWDKSSRIEDSGYIPKISRIYRYDVRTKTYRRLTNGSFQDRYPTYSPDGKYIAFVSDRSRNRELWIVHRDGTGLRQVTDMASRQLEVTPDKPAWSPDRTMILFSAAPVKAKPGVDDFPFEGSRIWSVQLLQGE